MRQISPTDNVTFKEEAFYSLCWRTPPEVAVAMPWSLGACRRLEFWTDAPCTQRCLVITRATFPNYRARLGLTKLADEEDTMLALFLRPQLLRSLVFKGDILDGAATIASLASLGRQHLVTYSCYTGELELDVVRSEYGKQTACLPFHSMPPRRCSKLHAIHEDITEGRDDCMSSANQFAYVPYLCLDPV